MIDMSVKLSSGYFQVQHPDFNENKSINNVFSIPDNLDQTLQDIPEITVISKRLQSFALLSSGLTTRGGIVLGIDPDKDRLISNFQNWISEGEFLKPNDRSVLLTYNIAKHLKIGVNDTIILIGQGYHGVSASGAFPVKGILKFKTPQMNSMGVIMDVKLAQELYSTQDKISSLIIMVDGYNNVKSTQKQLKDTESIASLKVLNWRDLNPELLQFIEMKKGSSKIMIMILYIVIGFGIFGTIIMMVAERKHELGVMIAVGMQRMKLSIILLYETILVGFIGVISGFIVSIPVVLLFVEKPIKLPPEAAEVYLQYGFEPYLFFGATPKVFINQMITVFVLTLIISIYPIMKVKNIKVTTALRA